MKNYRLTILFCTFLLITVQMTSGIIASTTSTEIDLKGKLSVPGTKSIENPIPIKASTDGESIFIDFLVAVGDITISLYNSDGQLVYQSDEQIASIQQVVVDITSLTSGSYTLTFTCDGGGYVYGTFAK